MTNWRTWRVLVLISLFGTLTACNFQALRPADTAMSASATGEDTPPAHGRPADLEISDFDLYDFPGAYGQSTAAGGAEGSRDADTGEAPNDLWERIRAGYALPEVSHPDVDRHVKWLQGNQGYLDRVAERARPYLHHIVEEIERRDMPLELALLPVVESAYQPFAYSHGRAAGIWQFVPATGRRFGLKQNWWYDGRRDIAASTNAALEYLASLNDRFKGDWLHAIAAYNCGEGNVAKAIARNRRAGKPTRFWDLKLPRETRSYVPRLLAVARTFGAPEAHGVSLPSIADQAYLGPVDITSQIDLALAADLADISLEDIYRLNPGFNRWATDPSGPHTLLLPLDKHDAFSEQLASLAPEKRVQWERHRIRSGETLSQIARRYRTTIGVLKEFNGLRGTRIRAGHSLIVPVATKSMKDYSLSADARRRTVQSRPRRGSKTTYVVRSGDSLWHIARRHRVTTKQLARWNGMAPRDTLHPGQKLAIWQKPGVRKVALSTHASSPAVTGETRRRIRYTVRDGESLWRISRRFNVSVTSLRRWNGLKKGQYLQPGQTLKVYVDITRQAEST